MNPWAIVAALVFWIASLAGVGSWQNGAGHIEEHAIWQAKDNKELADANAQILKLENEARERERLHAQQMAEISTQLEKENQDAKLKMAALAAGLRDGTIILRDPGSPSLQARRCGTGKTSPGASQCDGKTGSKLSRAASEFLFQLTGEADEVARQLEACQQTLISDRSEK